jgi:low molecular weight protein-tyrosine phosphatase
MYRLCFVCLGNICRSPTAEGVFLDLLDREGLAEKFDVDSAGTAGWHVGRRADPRSREAAARRGFDLPSRARRFEADDLARFDLVLVMDVENRRDVLELARTDEERSRVKLFRDFDPAAHPGAEVPDPYHGGADGFETVLDICERASQGLLDWARSSGRISS